MERGRALGSEAGVHFPKGTVLSHFRCIMFCLAKLAKLDGPSLDGEHPSTASVACFFEQLCHLVLDVGS